MKAVRTCCLALFFFALPFSTAETARAQGRTAFFEWLLVRLGATPLRVPAAQLEALELLTASRIETLAARRALFREGSSFLELDSANLLRLQRNFVTSPDLSRLMQEINAGSSRSGMTRKILTGAPTDLGPLQSLGATIAKEKTPFLDIGVLDGKIKIGELYKSDNLIIRGGEFNAYGLALKYGVPGGLTIYCMTSECFSKYSKMLSDSLEDLKNTKELLEMARKARAGGGGPGTPSTSPPVQSLE